LDQYSISVVGGDFILFGNFAAEEPVEAFLVKVAPLRYPAFQCFKVRSTAEVEALQDLTCLDPFVELGLGCG